MALQSKYRENITTTIVEHIYQKFRDFSKVEHILDIKTNTKLMKLEIKKRNYREQMNL